jgi:hypothetical protein
VDRSPKKKFASILPALGDIGFNFEHLGGDESLKACDLDQDQEHEGRRPLERSEGKKFASFRRGTGQFLSNSNRGMSAN